jgi:uncharacterized membrane protein
MLVELLEPAQRLALGLVAAGAAGAALLLAWRRARPSAIVALVAIAIVAVAALALEQAIAWLAAAAAPADQAFNEHRWVVMAPWGQVGLLLGLAIGVATVAMSWLGNARLASPWRRALLLGLRSAAVACALVVFFEPAIELRQVAREANRVAVLVDDSRSMALIDRPGGPTRAARARAVLDASRATFERWKGAHQVDLYTFADAVLPAALDTVATRPPTGKATLLRQALEQVRARYAGPELAGIVLLTDGVATDDLAGGLGAGAARDFLRGLDTRVHGVWTAEPGLRDVAIARVLADEFAFVRTVAKVEVVVRSTGYGARRIPVTLSSDGVPIRTKQVELAAGQVEARITFELTPPKVGKYVYQIATPVAADEAVTENNASAFVLRVIRDKIRVLQVAGQPSWDVRATRGLFEQNPNVDLISFFILRTRDDLSNAGDDELSLIPFPTRELFEDQLPSFDLVVLQNFDYAPYGIEPYLEDIERYVAGGGALVMLGGDRSFGSGDYQDTPVARALPVVLPRGRSPGELIDTADFAPRLTTAGASHPITALRFDPADNQAAWRALPALEGVNLTEGARDDATVLAVHPTLKTRRGDPMPVMVAGQYKEGRTFVVTTDSLWRWGFVASGQPGGDGRAFVKLWDNAMRWLMDDPDLRYLHVTSDRVEYAPGDAAELEVRLLERDYQPRAGALELEVIRERPAYPAGHAVEVGPATTAGGRAEPIAALALTTGDDGRVRHRLPDLAPGVYRVRAKATLGVRALEATDVFLVREASAELAHPAPDPALLETVAQATGGRALGPIAAIPADLDLLPPRVIRVDSRRDVELWSRPLLLLFALGFLGLEWGLRQRSGTL